MTATQRWAITVVAGFVCVAIWVLSVVTPPILTVETPYNWFILIAGLAALGINLKDGFQAVQTVDAVNAKFEVEDDK